MIDFTDIELAITAKIQAESEFSIPFEYPQADLATYPDDLWGKFTNLRSTGVPVTLGPAGQDEYVGVIQIDINYPAGKGTGPLLGKMTEVVRAFVPGTNLIRNDMCVRIVSVSPSPERLVGGYVKVIVSANYTVRANRA